MVEIEPDMELVAQASTGREAIEQFRRNRPDINLMDLQMPDLSGIEAIIAIRNEFPDAWIVVLPTYAGDVQVVRALKASARGYLLKGNVHTDLLETIRAETRPRWGAKSHFWWASHSCGSQYARCLTQAEDLSVRISHLTKAGWALIECAFRDRAAAMEAATSGISAEERGAAVALLKKLGLSARQR